MKKLVLFAGILVAVSFASCNSSKTEAPAVEEAAAVEEVVAAAEECCGDSTCCQGDSCCGACCADSTVVAE